MPLVIPYTFSSLAVADPAAVNANFAAVATYLDSTKLTTANLQQPYAQFTLSFSVEAALAGGSSKSFWFRVPAGQVWYGVEAGLGLAAITSSPVIVMNGSVTSGGLTVDILTAPCSETAVGTVTPRSDFVWAAYPAGSIVEVVIENTASGADSATGIYGTLTFKVLLRS